jgi:hypothetical protein
MVGLRRDMVECSWSLRYKGDHGGTFFQGNCFPAGVTAADDVVVCASDFCNEDDGTREEQVGRLDAIYQRDGISVTPC